MTTHHFLSVTVRVPALLRHFSSVKAHVMTYADEGMLMKTAFSETFGEGNWPKPFAVRQRGPDGSYEILAYSKRSPDDLASIYMPIPSLAAAVPIDQVMGYPLTAPKIGTELRFHVTFCPMVRTYRDRSRDIKGRERDAFTIEVEKAETVGRDPDDRMSVYREYLAKRMAGADVLAAQPMGFSIQKIQRGKGEKIHRFAVPSATFLGILRVTDPSVFLNTVVSGIGRQRTYGFGMILLGASAPKADISA